MIPTEKVHVHVHVHVQCRPHTVHCVCLYSLIPRLTVQYTKERAWYWLYAYALNPNIQFSVINETVMSPESRIPAVLCLCSIAACYDCRSAQGYFISKMLIDRAISYPLPTVKQWPAGVKPDPLWTTVSGTEQWATDHCKGRKRTHSLLYFTIQPTVLTNKNQWLQYVAYFVVIFMTSWMIKCMHKQSVPGSLLHVLRAGEQG